MVEEILAQAQEVKPTEPVETKPTEPVATPEQKASDDRVSSKLQMLIKREKQALALEQSAKTKEQAIAAKEAAFAAREAKLTEFENLKTTNPLKALELMGLDYDQLTQIKLADGNIPPEVKVRKVEERLEGLEKLREKEKQEALEQEKITAQRREQETIEQYQREIESHIDANPKEYEYIRFEGQQKLVYQVIDEHYMKTIDPETGIGKIMQIPEAAKLVEAFLEKKYDKVKDLEKFKSKLMPVQHKSQDKPEPIRYKPQTLSNNMGAMAQAKPRAHILTDEERIQKAIAYARGLRP